MKYVLILFLLIIFTSCTITPGYYSSNYSLISPVVPIISPPIYPSPYYFQPWYRPRNYSWSYTPRPRNSILITTPSYHSGPRGGRRK
jgi:hypothetical protein